MSKHDPDIVKYFEDALKGCENFSENDLLNAINPTILAVEKEDSYSTKEKLKIYSLLTTLTNSEPNERVKYVKKVAKILK